jgi:hypothetical protein
MDSNIINERLKKFGVPFNSNLPELEKNRFKNSKDVAIRVNIMHVFIAIYDNPESIHFFNNLIKELGLYNFLSKSEKVILERGKFLKQEEIDISWYQESLFVLCWCMGIIDKVESPLKEVKLGHIFSLIPPEVDLNKFIQTSKLIDGNRIKLELYFYYAIHWALKHPNEWGFFNKFKYSKFDISIIKERRKALEWVFDENVGWDEVSLDT